MAKDKDLLQFFKARGDTVQNLQAIRLNLSRCVEGGMVDLDDTYYNELLALTDEATLSKTWDELMEVISKAKTLEIDVAAWLANQGQTSISLPWPRRT